MKLLFLSSYYPPDTLGGAEISTHYLAQALVERGHEVTVITEGEGRQERMLNGVRVLERPWPLTAKPLFERRHSRLIARKLQQDITLADYDIVHAHDFRTALVLAEIGLPNALVTVRDYAQVCGSPNNLQSDGTTGGGTTIMGILRNTGIVEAPWWRKPFRFWQYWFNIGYRLRAFQSFSTQVFISHAQREEISKTQSLEHQKTHVIYNPVPPLFLSAAPTAPPTGNILYVGTLGSYKGVDVLLKAFAQLAQEDPDLRLTLVGDGALRGNYDRWVAVHGLGYRVTFVGRVSWSRIQHYYDEAHIVVAPHVWTEPFGRTVVEAMARERIVIAANVGGPSEIITDGTTGFLFKRGSVSSLTQVLHEALLLGESSQREIRRSARSWVAENLTPERIAKQYEDVYITLARSIS